MRIKTLIVLIMLTPLLGFNIAKADICPHPEEFKKGFGLMKDDDGNIELNINEPLFYAGISNKKPDFMLQKKPIKFSSAIFMSSQTEENSNEATGELYACKYYVKREFEPKLAMSQAKKYRRASILLDASSNWEKHPKIKRRYDCSSNNTDDCPFTLE